jgi:hypothetical protein
MFDIDVTLASGMPAGVNEEPEVAEEAAPEQTTAEPLAAEPTTTGESPAEDDTPLVEIALNSPEYAKSVEHLSTHFPKNPHCEWCNRANLQAAPARRTPAPEKAEPIETQPMSHIYGYHLVMGQRSEGSQKERACLLLIDSHTGLERAYPAPSKDQKH